MELTIEQALQQGVAAHKEGNLEDAERLYRAILQSQPKHPDANPNLGVLAAALNQAAAALPLFKIALEENPKIEQFWLSYIDALIKEKQFENAKKAFDQCKMQGVSGETLNILEALLAPETQTENGKSASPSQQQISTLIEHYKNGWYEDAQKLAISMNQEFPHHQFGWKVIGAVFKQKGMNAEALNANQKAMELAPQDPEVHNNVGVSLKELGRLEEAEASLREALKLNSEYAEAHNNLSNTLKALGRLKEAEASVRQAIALNPDYAKAHFNLGNTLKERGKLDEAETSFKQAIAIKSDYVEAHNNRGNTLKELGRLEEAEASYRQAISLKFDFAEAHSNLGIILYINGDIDSGLESLEKANDIDPKLENNELILTILQARKTRVETELSTNNMSNKSYGTEQYVYPLFANRAVEAEIIPSLYKMKYLELEKFADRNIQDARFGKGICSPDFRMFEGECPIIKGVEEDLIDIMKMAVNSEIYVYDSFFNILRTGGGSTPHRHLSKLDLDKFLNLGSQKYSLVYYLSVGDQNCSEPGVLKLYNPSEDILPCEGMIVIIPADRRHSAVYGGKTDRVMIGINFYSI